MQRKFTYGFLSGISAIVLAFPVVAQISSAQSGAVSTDVKTWTRPAPTTENVQQMIDHDNAFLTNVDALIAAQKAATTTHRDALVAAQNITDETARQAAVQAAHEALRTSMRSFMEAHPDLKGGMFMGFGPGGRHHGPGPADLARKLGMTEDELKSALEEGKTIEELAQEKGIELPAKGARMFMKKMGSSSSEQ